MKKLFVVVGKCKDENDDGKEICRFIVDDDGASIRGKEKLCKLSDKKTNNLITVLEQLLIPVLKANKQEDSILLDNKIDVSKLDKNEIQYVLETCLNYINTFAHGAGLDDDIDMINKIVDKATIKDVIIPHNTTVN